jgi:hypothetical protein
MRFDSSPVLFGQPPDYLRDAAALPGSGEIEGMFDRCGPRHSLLLAQPSRRCECPHPTRCRYWGGAGALSGLQRWKDMPETI